MGLHPDQQLVPSHRRAEKHRCFAAWTLVPVGTGVSPQVGIPSHARKFCSNGELCWGIPSTWITAPAHSLLLLFVLLSVVVVVLAADVHAVVVVVLVDAGCVCPSCSIFVMSCLLMFLKHEMHLHLCKQGHVSSKRLCMNRQST